MRAAEPIGGRSEGDAPWGAEADVPAGLILLRAEGSWGGPVYTYRGAEVWSDAASARWQVWISDHPLRGLTLYGPDRAIRIVDAWAEGRRLPVT